MFFAQQSLHLTPTNCKRGSLPVHNILTQQMWEFTGSLRKGQDSFRDRHWKRDTSQVNIWFGFFEEIESGSFKLIFFLVDITGGGATCVNPLYNFLVVFSSLFGATHLLFTQYRQITYCLLHGERDSRRRR